MRYNKAKEILVRQFVVLSAVYVMLTEGLKYYEAKAKVKHEYFKKCYLTGKPNILFRPAQLGTTEDGPQIRYNNQYGGDWWLLLIIVIVLRWLYKKLKK